MYFTLLLYFMQFWAAPLFFHIVIPTCSCIVAEPYARVWERIKFEYMRIREANKNFSHVFASSKLNNILFFFSKSPPSSPCIFATHCSIHSIVLLSPFAALCEKKNEILEKEPKLKVENEEKRKKLCLEIWGSRWVEGRRVTKWRNI